jgi:serpin B
MARSRACLVCGLIALAGCGDGSRRHGDTGPRTPPPGEAVVGSVAITADAVPGTVAQLVHDNTAAALNLFRAAAPADESFVFSPHSVALAMAMTYEGARAETERQMAEAMRFTLPKPDLHAAFAHLAATLDEGVVGSLRLRIINALFGQAGFVFNQPFVDTVASHYRAPMSRLDFAGATDAARKAINEWVAEETEGLVPALLPMDLPTARTVLVLMNAIAFRGLWRDRFTAISQPAAFRALDGSAPLVPTMTLTGKLPYAQTDRWQALELPYEGDAYSMVVLLPGQPPSPFSLESAPFDKALFTDFEATLDADKLATIVAALAETDVIVTLPKFSLRSQARLDAPLGRLGMKDAFTGSADLSGIGGPPGFLFIEAIVHEAYLEVDETGTRAAASTAVVVGRKSVTPRPIFRADHPFLFAIRERATGTLIFLGRYAGP